MAAQLPLARYFPELQKSYEGETRYLEILKRIMFPDDRDFMYYRHALVRPSFGRSAASSGDHCSCYPRSAKDFECSVGFACCADRSLFRRTPRSNARSGDLSIGDHPASTMDGEKQKPKRQGAGRRSD
jgi:hypothetical protein